MYARVTQYQLKADRVEEAIARLEGLIPEIRAIPGLVELIDCYNEDGAGVAVAIYESEEAATAALEKVGAIWGQFADFLAAEPKPEFFSNVLRETVR